MDSHKETTNYSAWQKHEHQLQSGSEGLHVNRDHEGLQSIPFSEASPPNKQKKELERRILGLTVPIFWSVAAVLVLLLAGGIGAGVGVGLSSQTSKPSSCPQPSSTPLPNAAIACSQTSSSTSVTTPISSSTTTAPTSGPSPIISTPCINNPSANNQVLSAKDSSGGQATAAFTLQCNTNYPAGATYANPNVIDLWRLWVPDMTSCINACAQYNKGYAVTKATNPTPKCVAVAIVRGEGEYCYLKSATGKNDTSTSGGVPIDSAILIQS